MNKLPMYRGARSFITNSNTIMNIFLFFIAPRYRIPGLSAELRALAIIFGFDPKDDDDFKYLWKTYVETPFDSDRRFIMKAFSRVKDKKKLQM